MSIRALLKTLIGLLIYQRLQEPFGQIDKNITKHLLGLKHRHLAGAFFLALIPDNNFVSYEYISPNLFEVNAPNHALSKSNDVCVSLKP
ncbi:hypothetical protein KM914_06150 [Virgibacillus pantothenticus]|nr:MULTISPECIES: hypothetical protein [Virgibacillus]MBS7427483.1 hypothetical protein [Virgibacillus sp. 19R1-5]MBU8566026.1 hypothetical protein [Virgibacillus pantothenticus]MBU8601003.1 hypothetical protein [Virgibacillus pantothenticus]MBU8632994.1 hypothetical protein [Virgibacillus pantothenticus]MBU8643153.1 hypothetical protein [Virgibacillus pantothenticus]